MIRKLTGAALLILSTAGCQSLEDQSVAPVAPPPPLQPTYVNGKFVTRLSPSVAQRTQRVENGQMVDVYWAALSETDRRKLYSAVVVDTIIEQRDSNGTFSVAPLGARYSKGYYRVTHEVFLGQQVPCRTDISNAGVVKMGVKLEVQIELQSRKSGIDIASLVPLAAAASDEKVSGRLAIRLWGFGATSGILNSYLTSGGQLNLQSVTRAMEAMAVARAILEDPNAITTPYHVELIETTEGACNASPLAPPRET